MFVNDTGRLPDSGRVCVMGFQPESSGTRTFYSLFINAARAEVEPMSEPRNPAHVLGVGTEIESVNGPVFAAYFAASRERFDAQPNYKSGLFVLVDGAVYAVKAGADRHEHPPRLQHARVHAAARRPAATQRRLSVALVPRAVRVGRQRRALRRFPARDVGDGARIRLSARGYPPVFLLDVTAKLFAHR